MFCAEVRLCDSVSKLCTQAARVMLQLATTVMFIPTIATSFRVYKCQTTWFDTAWTCYKSHHMLLVVVVTLLLAMFLSITLFGASSAPLFE
jgi:hypothetical protein